MVQRCLPVWNSRAKHATHLFCFFFFIIVFEMGTGALRFGSNSEGNQFSPTVRYGLLLCLFLYSLRFASLLVLPQCIFNLLGLICFNAFQDNVKLNNSPLLAPFICIRVVTKGDYPNLVGRNVESNIETCLKAGLEYFIVEVVTDKAVNLKQTSRTREILVPSNYATKSGALFKARALQYCWEDGVNELRDSDWIVHLDEETLLTEDSVRGILNFCSEGKHHFGQGLITYANGNIVNWITTLADSFRVADDMGKLQFQFRVFEKPMFGWKGSYVVTKASAERAVSFDNGLHGSIAEDCYFAMIAYRDGYRFQFIEGEMHEKSPFTLWDFLQQRKRWLQGIYLVVHSSELPWRCKFFLAMSFYAWATMPLTTMNIILAYVLPLPSHALCDFLVAFVGAVNLYMYVFGVWKSLAARFCHKPLVLLYYTLAAIVVIPVNVCIEIVAVILGLLGRKNQFYVVRKDPLFWMV